MKIHKDVEKGNFVIYLIRPELMLKEKSDLWVINSMKIGALQTNYQASSNGNAPRTNDGFIDTASEPFQELNQQCSLYAEESGQSEQRHKTPTACRPNVFDQPVAVCHPAQTCPNRAAY